MSIFKFKGEVGVNDQPSVIQNGSDRDALEVGKYIRALEEFVKVCPTPMSIALQGDWGTGKTTFLRSMEQDFKSETGIISIYFNTWQYSQFNMSGELYFSFITNIVAKLSHETTEVRISELRNKLMNLVVKMSKQAISKTVSNFGVNIDSFLEPEEERAGSIDKLKQDFEKLISEVTDKSKRVVIFVDDLDRLDPKVAVELLEVMKLFMDVKNCVFVLAIDYDVVVSGVKQKFGKELSDAKCRSFFDKIIQLPFRMPVENYNISKLLNNILPTKEISELGANLKVIEKMAKSTVGSNPRTLKRLVNSFSLLTIVNRQDKEDGKDMEAPYYTLLLLVLIVQMYDPDTYAKLVSANDSDTEVLRGMIEGKQNVDGAAGQADKNGESGTESIALEHLSEALNELVSGSRNDAEKERSRVYDLLNSVLTLSSITSVSKNVEETVQKKNVDLGGFEVTAVRMGDRTLNITEKRGSQAEAYVNSMLYAFDMAMKSGMSKEEFQQIICKEAPLDLVFAEQNDRRWKSIRASDPKIHDEMFSAFFSAFVAEPASLFVGLNIADKRRHMRRICSLLDIPENTLKWKGTDKEGNEAVFEIW